MPVEVHEARPAEYEDAGRVMAAAYREFVPAVEPSSWEAYLAHIGDIAGRAGRTTILVAVDDGAVLGSATLELEARIDDDDPPLRPQEAHIRMLGANPSARRRGVARSLMEACLRRAWDAGKTLVTLHTTPRMHAAQRMYESLGFVREDDRVLPDGFVLLTYARQLDVGLA